MGVFRVGFWRIANIEDWLGEGVEFQPSGDLVTLYPHRGAAALISFRANALAAKLYTSMGFVESGLDDDEFVEPNYKLVGAALDKHREQGVSRFVSPSGGCRKERFARGD